MNGNLQYFRNKSSWVQLFWALCFFNEDDKNKMDSQRIVIVLIPYFIYIETSEKFKLNFQFKFIFCKWNAQDKVPCISKVLGISHQNVFCWKLYHWSIDRQLNLLAFLKKQFEIIKWFNFVQTSYGTRNWSGIYILNQKPHK